MNSLTAILYVSIAALALSMAFCAGALGVLQSM